MSECTLIFEPPISPAGIAHSKKLVADALRALSLKCANEMADLSIKLTDDEHITELNHQFRGMEKSTNVLSFPSNDAAYLGDIAISLPTITAEASKQGKKYDHHLMHMVVHGVLHLLGHDHEDDDEAEDMEALEIDILKNLGIANPYT